MITATIDVGTLPEVQAAVERLGSVVENIATDVLDVIGDETRDTLIDATPVGGGELAAGWQKEMFHMGVRVYNDVPHAEWVQYGTGIHGPRAQPIIPRKAKALVFEVAGGAAPIVVKSVSGQEPQDMLGAVDTNQVVNQISEALVGGIEVYIDASIRGVPVSAMPTYFERRGQHVRQYRGPGGQFAKPG